MGAANYLKMLGSDAREAIPALKLQLSDPYERFRRLVEQALQAIE